MWRSEKIGKGLRLFVYILPALFQSLVPNGTLISCGDRMEAPKVLPKIKQCHYLLLEQLLEYYKKVKGKILTGNPKLLLLCIYNKKLRTIFLKSKLQIVCKFWFSFPFQGSSPGVLRGPHGDHGLYQVGPIQGKHSGPYKFGS